MSEKEIFCSLSVQEKRISPVIRELGKKNFNLFTGIFTDDVTIDLYDRIRNNDHEISLDLYKRVKPVYNLFHEVYFRKYSVLNILNTVRVLQGMRDTLIILVDTKGTLIEKVECIIDNNYSLFQDNRYKKLTEISLVNHFLRQEDNTSVIGENIVKEGLNYNSLEKDLNVALRMWKSYV